MPALDDGGRHRAPILARLQLKHTMTNTHTPGPWTLAADMYGIGNLKVHGVEARANGVTQPIANCGWDSSGESECNARLIAAAPDLLAALERIVDATDQTEADGWSSGQLVDALFGHIEAARATIAKAVQP